MTNQPPLTHRCRTIFIAGAVALGAVVAAGGTTSADSHPGQVRLAYDPAPSGYFVMSSYSPHGAHAVINEPGENKFLQLSIATGVTKEITIPDPIAIDSGTLTFGIDGNTIHRQNMSTGTTSTAVIPFTTGYGAFEIEGADASGRFVLVRARNGNTGRTRTFLFDFTTATLVTPEPLGVMAAGSTGHSSGLLLSEDGNAVTYADFSTVGASSSRVVQWNRATDVRIVVERPAEHDAFSGTWAASEDTQWVVFPGSQADIVPGLDATTRLYVRHLSTGETMAVPTDHSKITSYKVHPGGRVVFVTNAPTSTNGDLPQLFVWNPGDVAVAQISVGPTGEPADEPIDEPFGSSPFGSSANGTSVVFSTFAFNLAPGTTDPERRVFEVTLPALPGAGGPLTSVEPARLLESRIGDEYETHDGLYEGTGRTKAKGIAEVEVTGRGGVDDDATAVFLNVVADNPTGAGYLTVFPCGTTPPLAASVNYNGNDTIGNAVLAKIGDGGKVCIYSHANTDIIIDVNGFVPADSSPTPVDPARLLESRIGDEYETHDGLYEGTGRTKAKGIAEVEVTGRGGVDDDATAVFLNVVADNPTGAGYLTVFPCGTTPPLAASVNYNGNDTIGNAVLAKIGDGGKVCIYSHANTDIIIDVNGFVPADSSPTPVDPARLLESRIGDEYETHDGLYEGTGRTKAKGIAEVEVTGRGGVDDDATAVFLNVVADNPTGAGYLTVFPCGTTPPLAASVNYNGNDTIGNAVLAKIGDGGKVCIYSHANTDIIIDVNGFVPA